MPNKEELEQKMRAKTDDELLRMMANPKDWTSEAIDVGNSELLRRGIQLEESTNSAQVRRMKYEYYTIEINRNILVGIFGGLICIIIINLVLSSRHLVDPMLCLAFYVYISYILIGRKVRHLKFDGSKLTIEKFGKNWVRLSMFELGFFKGYEVQADELKWRKEGNRLSIFDGSKWSLIVMGGQSQGIIEWFKENGILEDRD